MKTIPVDQFIAGLCTIPEEDFASGVYDYIEPVHRVMNLREFNRRAVSLHTYSKPFDRCLVYSVVENRYREIPLHYTSEYGELCEGERL